MPSDIMLSTEDIISSYNVLWIEHNI